MLSSKVFAGLSMMLSSLLGNGHLLEDLNSWSPRLVRIRDILDNLHEGLREAALEEADHRQPKGTRLLEEDMAQVKEENFLTVARHGDPTRGRRDLHPPQLRRQQTCTMG